MIDSNRPILVVPLLGDTYLLDRVILQINRANRGNVMNHFWDLNGASYFEGLVGDVEVVFEMTTIHS
jgi:hypothetical protein